MMHDRRWMMVWDENPRMTSLWDPKVRMDRKERERNRPVQWEFLVSLLLRRRTYVDDPHENRSQRNGLLF